MFAFSMSRLWGNINSIQIVLQLPLCSVRMPANVQLIYYFIQYNFNIELIQLDFIDFQSVFFDSEQSQTSGRRVLQGSEEDEMDNQEVEDVLRTTYSDTFFGQGYMSHLIVDNIYSVISNLYIVFIASVVFKMFDFVCSLFGLFNQSDYYMSVRHLMLNTIIFQFLIESSMQIFTFALADIYSQLTLRDKVDSTSLHIFSLITSLLFFGLCILCSVDMIYISRALLKSKNREQEIAQSRYSSLFNDLRTTNIHCLLYYPIFIFRRFSAALTIVLLQDNASAQINLLLILSLVMLYYMIAVRPFRERLLNYLEIMNEVFVLCSSYHLLIFTDWVGEPNFQYLMGWSLNLLLILQFLLNSAIFIAQLAAFMYMNLKSLLVKIGEKIKLFSRKREPKLEKRKPYQISYIESSFFPEAKSSYLAQRQDWNLIRMAQEIKSRDKFDIKLPNINHTSDQRPISMVEKAKHLAFIRFREMTDQDETNMTVSNEQMPYENNNSSLFEAQVGI
ncbi:hypothetical protein FGO68_gene10275 [Halteria grandinella]|uniref:TRP C-terminal domain-containing protein n=1 Tax=Halteria grandinella TaxID=5974 RepID=A0A8J8SYD6_HALGN|nr:hypothetical protein FGO68_gene10275 [Halteria grandinella]